MSNIVVSLQKTAEEFLGNMNKIDLSPIREVVDNLVADNISESDRKNAIDVLNEWVALTLAKIENKTLVLERFMGYKRERRVCYFLPHYTSTDTYTEMMIGLVEGLATDVGMKARFLETKKAINDLEKLFVLSEIDHSTETEWATQRHKDHVQNQRLMRQSLLLDLKFKDELFNHPDIVSFIEQTKDLKKNLNKTKKGVESLENIARINLVTTSEEHRKELLNLYKVLSM